VEYGAYEEAEAANGEHGDDVEAMDFKPGCESWVRGAAFHDDVDYLASEGYGAAGWCSYGATNLVERRCI
jgi:hypothetical protein